MPKVYTSTHTHSKATTGSRPAAAVHHHTYSTHAHRQPRNLFQCGTSPFRSSLLALDLHKQHTSVSHAIVTQSQLFLLPPPPWTELLTILLTYRRTNTLYIPRLGFVRNIRHCRKQMPSVQPCMPHSRPAVRSFVVRWARPPNPYLYYLTLPAFSQAYGIPLVLYIVTAESHPEFRRAWALLVLLSFSVRVR
ncbi:hypothetical protein BO83DRAFT_102049 [Aspergillus eucalypticola CBS 122712]|uniref:Uncharacterized protein n=1 Tax=Aspergillus eucalypticola (strain CBS 122712 / IBT 29274) TaxID=1448314 RepID=A0A317UXU0_ASPEC|nr:uncharacterized protein BO83DRAFT_102049 [Aspergillus eucalypticola CBS 122712]PWY66863.1 hypothetical protein BO83DRAFT_102049 [Aspergillus eucalypticola CBS 122712]